MSLSQSYVFAQTKPINENSNPTPITLKVQHVADNLEALTDIVFPGNGDIWVAEQKGKIPVLAQVCGLALCKVNLCH